MRDAPWATGTGDALMVAAAASMMRTLRESMVRMIRSKIVG